MNLKTAKSLSFDELRNVYREYLYSKGLGKNTVQTAYSDTFYLWRKVGADEFWATIAADDFDVAAREALMNALKENTTGDPAKLVPGYLSHLKRFRDFLLNDDGTKKAAKMKKAPLHHGRKRIQVPDPSPQQVDHYLHAWDELENYRLQEDALDNLFFSLCPRNTEMSDILLKVAALNDFYSTNIFSVFPVAKHIQSLDIDARLKAGDVTLVSAIQKVIINGVEKNFYSFATKYCSHHNPLDYPIYDSYVDKVLCFFRNRDAFSSFRTEDLKDYVIFKGVLIDFRAFYGLEMYNLKEIDKYIWQLGKEFFPKSYGNKK